ncbi:MAG: NAD(P)-dependent glycerol-3-phosphate dehydrogenase [Oscillospiraceae bacterium]|nr:NAD(P)-dependent glycerol-3-phosphate dehydrogenase [Oscillospiraceae bacterium]
MKNIAIIGSGSWGTALSIHLGKMGHSVKMWSYSKEEADLINNERKCKFLPKVAIPDGIVCTTDLGESVQGSEIVLMVTPSRVVRETTAKLKEYLTDQQILMCSKGIEKDTLYTLNEVLEEELPGFKIGALTGPSHAEEVSIGNPTAIVVASEHEDLLENIQKSFSNENLRIYKSKDIKGAELGGALKTVIAFCASVSVGLKLGDNAFLAVITRGLHEMAMIAEKMGACKDTIYGLTGLGDLLASCLSEHSRNRRAGILVGEGMNIDEVRREVGMVIEGIDNIEAAYALSKAYDVEMPIISGVYDVLYNDKSVKEVAAALMTRELKYED